MIVTGDLFARLYLDHNVHLWLASALRRRGIDVVAAIEVGNECLTDEQQLGWAAQERRAVFTYDRVDFKRIAEEWAARGEPHAGIIVSLAPPELPTGTLIARLLRLLDARTADELLNLMIWLDASW